MINNSVLYNLLISNGIRFFTGVPDSTLKHFCAYLSDNAPKKDHIISANEGGAVALAAGHYLATNNPALVYMQNSGQGNALNPLASLADQEVYGIPMLLMIGWRGEPGKQDEPQHTKQGMITLSLLDTLGIPFFILPYEENESLKIMTTVFNILKAHNGPVALVVRKGTFETYNLNKRKSIYTITREEAIYNILDKMETTDVIISTTGKTSREVYEYREAKGQSHEKDFLTVGSMGHSSQIAMGIALAKSNRQIFCLDGDGAVIMHMGSLATIGSQNIPNFKHIIFNNGSHESVGGQPTAANNISLENIARECGYRHVFFAENRDQIVDGIKRLRFSTGPSLLEIKIKLGSRPDLGRPKSSPKDNKKIFMDFLNK